MNDPIAALAIEPADVGALQRGGVVLRTRPHGTGRTAVQGLVLVPVEADVAWNLLERWERMHEALPVLRFHIIRESMTANADRRALIVSEVSAGLITMRYTVWATFRGSEHRQWWSLVPNEEMQSLRRELPSLPMHSRLLRSVEGSLTVYPHQAGCLILHQNCLVPHPTIPRALEALLSKQMVRDFLAAVRRELLASAASAEGEAAADAGAGLLQPQ
jgi:hypothetical protein